MTVHKVPAEVFPPSEYIQDELDARGWSLDQFVIMAGLPAAEAKRLVKGDVRITPRLALALSRAFGSSGTLWYRLQTSFDAGPAPREARRP